MSWVSTKDELCKIEENKNKFERFNDARINSVVLFNTETEVGEVRYCTNSMVPVVNSQSKSKKRYKQSARETKAWIQPPPTAARIMLP